MTTQEIIQRNDIDVLIELSKKAHAFFKPLAQLGIIDFQFARSFYDRTQFNLGSNFPWLEDYYHQEFHKIGSFNKHPARYESGIYIWNDVGDRRLFQFARDHHDIGGGITIAEKQPDGCAFYFIGGTVDDRNITNFLVNNIGLLKKYIAYFQSENRTIIASASQHRVSLSLPDDPENVASNSDESCLLAESQTKIEAFLKVIQPKHIYLTKDNREIMLTKAECRCLSLLLRGKTAEETATALFISKRTVEKHLERVREKLDCHNKLQLITLLARHCHLL